MFLKYYINKLYNKVKNYLNFRLWCYSDFILNIVGLAAFNTFSGNYLYKKKREKEILFFPKNQNAKVISF